jgi:hypothetical protein
MLMGEVCFLYKYVNIFIYKLFINKYEDSIMKPTKHCLKRVGEERGKNGNIMEG